MSDDAHLWFEHLYREHRRGMLTCAVSWVALSEAEDIVHDALLDAWTKRADLRPGPGRGWLLESVRLRALNLRRRASIVAPAGMDLGGYLDGMLLLERREDLRAVLSAWQLLEERERELIVLADVLELAGAEIAQITDRTLAATYKAVARARKRRLAVFQQLGGDLP